jgi:hypothetical protein
MGAGGRAGAGCWTARRGAEPLLEPGDTADPDPERDGWGGAGGGAAPAVDAGGATLASTVDTVTPYPRCRAYCFIASLIK